MPDLFSKTELPINMPAVSEGANYKYLSHAKDLKIQHYAEIKVARQRKEKLCSNK